jgi:hypothetical protein
MAKAVAEVACALDDIAIAAEINKSKILFIKSRI